MDEFDYLNGSLRKWVAFFAYSDEGPVTGEALVELIQDEYLPNFEAAIWKASAFQNQS